MSQLKNNYNYEAYISSFQEATIRLLPTLPYMTPPTLPERDIAAKAAFTLIERAAVSGTEQKNDAFDFFSQKNEIARDKADLIWADIQERATLRNNNIRQLYDELLRIDNWRLERPFPESYQKDRIWLDFIKMEIKIREQIRRELQDSLRDTSFSKKDFRESALDFKKLQQKQSILAGGLEQTIQETYQK